MIETSHANECPHMTLSTFFFTYSLQLLADKVSKLTDLMSRLLLKGLMLVSVEVSCILLWVQSLQP